MELTGTVIDAEGNHRQQAERLARTRVPRIPANVHRQLLVQRLRRVADRPEA